MFELFFKKRRFLRNAKELLDNIQHVTWWFAPEATIDECLEKNFSWEEAKVIITLHARCDYEYGDPSNAVTLSACREKCSSGRRKVLNILQRAEVTDLMKEFIFNKVCGGGRICLRAKGSRF